MADCQLNKYFPRVVHLEGARYNRLEGGHTEKSRQKVMVGKKKEFGQI